MKLYDFSDIKKLMKPPCNDYIVVRINGLFGDTLHAACKFNYFKKLYPRNNWIIIHEYGQFDRVEQCLPFFRHLYESGLLKYYFFNKYFGSSRITRELRQLLNSLKIPNYKICDGYVFQTKPKILTYPDINVQIPEKKDPKKAIIFRRSAWHGHFPERNRPYSEWYKIEKKLLECGYTVYLLGYDDDMNVTDGVVDLRKKMKVHEILEFAKDASICITTTTFLYVWTQFICPTFILSAPGDIPNLRMHWKLTNYMTPLNIARSDYLKSLFNYINIINNKKYPKFEHTHRNIPSHNNGVLIKR